MHRSLFAALLFAASVVEAADVEVTAYNVRQSPGENSVVETVVYTNGVSFRAECVGEKGGGGTYDVLLSGEGGSIIALSSTLGTWFVLEHPAPLGVHSPYLAPLPPRDAKVSEVSWRLEPAEDQAGGDRTMRGRLSYLVTQKFDVHTVGVTVTAAIEVESDPEIDRSLWVGRILPVTGYAAADRQLAAADAAIDGFPRRMKLTAMRMYHGGPPMSSTMNVTVSDMRRETIDAARFNRPESYRNQPPIIGAPGR